MATYKYDIFVSANVDGEDEGNLYMFAGREFDEEVELHYYRARYYLDKIGKFSSRDEYGYADSMNLYSYVRKNRVNFDDPYGKSALGVTGRAIMRQLWS